MRRNHGHIGHFLPVEYQELKSIASSGAAGFKVAFTPKGDTPGFECKFHMTSAMLNDALYYYFGVYASGGYTAFSLYKSASTQATAANILGYNYYSTSGNKRIDLANTIDTSVQSFKVLNNVLTKCDGTTQNLTAHRQTYTYAGYVGVGCRWNGQTSAFMTESHTGYIHLHYFALYKASTLTYEFIPCLRRSDGKAGMYDMVNKVFHPSETGTDFITGDIL